MFSYSRIEGSVRSAYKFSMPLKLHIRDIRQSQGLTLATVAGRVGISIAHLSEVERGEKNLNNHLMERISAALGVRPDDLVSGEDDSDRAKARTRLQQAMSRMQSDASLEKLADYAETVLLAEQAGSQKQ